MKTTNNFFGPVDGSRKEALELLANHFGLEVIQVKGSSERIELTELDGKLNLKGV